MKTWTFYLQQQDDNYTGYNSFSNAFTLITHYISNNTWTLSHLIIILDIMHRSTLKFRQKYPPQLSKNPLGLKLPRTGITYLFRSAQLPLFINSKLHCHLFWRIIVHVFINLQYNRSLMQCLCPMCSVACVFCFVFVFLFLVFKFNMVDFICLLLSSACFVSCFCLAT